MEVADGLARKARFRGDDAVRVVSLSLAPVRTVRIGNIIADAPELGQEFRTECDSHADMCVISDNTALIIHDFQRPTNVYGFKEDVESVTLCKTVSGVIAYDHPANGETYYFIVHQALLIPEMKTNLLSTMQLRDNGIRVNDEPKHMVPTPTDENHAITIRADNPGEKDFIIPLSLHGIISYFTSRKPTRAEFENADEEHRIELTSETLEWDPKSDHYRQAEEAMIDDQGMLREDRQPDWTVDRVVAALHTLPQPDTPANLFGKALEATVECTVGALSAVRGKAIDAATLAKRWGVSLKVAARTLGATTQNIVRTVLHPTLSRRFRTNDRQLRYRRLQHDMFTDTLESKQTSWFRQNKYAQVFATSFGWARVFPMKQKSEAHEGLSLLAQRDGVPPLMVMDNAKEQTMGQFRKKAKEMNCRVKQTEPYSPWQNACEGAIRELKRGADRKATKMQSPSKLWDHCLELEGYIRSHTALDQYQLKGEVPETIVSGQTADISPFVEFGWYEWVMWWNTTSGYPEPREELGRWLGPDPDVGPALCSKVLKSNGQWIYTSTYRRLSEEELRDPKKREERAEFDRAVKEKLGGPDEFVDPDAKTPEYQLYEDDFEGTHVGIPDIDGVTPEINDEYIGAEVNLPYDGDMVAGRVTRRARNQDGELEGTSNANPILDTRVYQVEFPDGGVKEFSANAIAENMYAMCDADGHQHMLFDSIVADMVDENAVQKGDRFVIKNGKRYRRRTTIGWKLCVRWKDGSTSWERLADLKESFPIQVAEYAISRGLQHEPAFEWWVPHVLKKRDKIIKAVNSRYAKRNHKFGVEIPKTVAEAYALDEANGNTLWHDAIQKEMGAVRVAFAIMGEDEQPLPGSQYMDCHMVFDVKLDGFKRKARMVAGGHMVDAPSVMTYSSVVSRETVRIAFTYAALNDLEVKASDVQNAYLTAPCEENVWTVLGPEFGEDAGKSARVVRALYGLKSAGAAFGRHIADCMRHLGYKPCKADTDLWMKRMVRPDDGLEYWAYVLLYVDDCLCIHHDGEAALRELDKYFPMKKGSIGDPDVYLGSKIRKVKLPNGVEAWASCPSKYVQEAVGNVEAYLAKEYGGRKLQRRATSPWPTDYVCELDTSPELDAAKANYFQSQMGVLQWMVELGRTDIACEVSKLSSHLALPREGHLDAVFHVFAHLKLHHNSRMVFDPSYPQIHGEFHDHDWKGFYGDVKEAIPLDAPEPLGKDVDLRLYVDSDHAGDKLTRRSRTGFIIYLNSAPVVWMSKKQPTIETSVFGAEFVAMKHGMETLRGLRYKLRMMGIPISGPSYIYGDNMSVIHNTQRPESTLKKKSNSICYHAIRESVAMGECLTAHVRSEDNPADPFTKIMFGTKRKHLVSMTLYDLYDHDHGGKRLRSV